MGLDEKIVWNVSGGQVNVASGNATINATQNNAIDANELNSIIKSIKENLSGIEKEDAENIMDIVGMVKQELEKPEPKVSRLRNCITLIAPMVTIANGVPVLMNNLKQFQAFIMLYIK